MPQSVANVIALAVVGYAVIGVVFGVVFVARGAAALEPGAKAAPWGFRLIILPASAALWPWLLARWARVGRGGAP